jgi:hypothetical protein
MPGNDDDLLARLNALKPSSVSLNNLPKASLDTTENKPLSREDKLADRLKALRTGASGDIKSRSDGFGSSSDRAEALTAQTRDEVATEHDPIRNCQQPENDDEILDELLGQLADEGDQWKLNPDDPKDVQSLPKEAKAALPQEAEDVENSVATEDEKWQQIDDSDSGGGGSRNQHVNQDEQDEEAADDVVKRLLAELDIESKYGPGDNEDEAQTQGGESNRDGKTTMELPSTPSNLPPPASGSEPPSYEESELEARFAKLGLELPSTPSAPPSAKPRVTASISKSKGKANLPVYTDEDIESWCCICNEDGEVKCLGCDGDIYCQDCWSQGHGNGPGQERGHRAAQYMRKGGGTDLAAA